jgi:hypothetical protein
MPVRTLLLEGDGPSAAAIKSYVSTPPTFPRTPCVATPKPPLRMCYYTQVVFHFYQVRYTIREWCMKYKTTYTLLSVRGSLRTPVRLQTFGAPFRFPSPLYLQMRLPVACVRYRLDKRCGTFQQHNPSSSAPSDPPLTLAAR